jgi:pSer/pThr/pTyr-binding forkhead associated (FHA) protein
MNRSQVGPLRTDPAVFLLGRSAAPSGEKPDAQKPFTVGRAPECDISIGDFSVSRLHAHLQRDPVTGRWMVTDLGSSNGTRVGGSPIVANQPELLWDKIRLQFGDVELHFMLPKSFLAYLEHLSASK